MKTAREGDIPRGRLFGREAARVRRVSRASPAGMRCRDNSRPMNAASLARTLETGQVTYWSRSRAELWAKGATSGHVQRLVELRIDCDRDALLLRVDQTGPACHTNRRSCFYTAVRDGAEAEIMAPL